MKIKNVLNKKDGIMADLSTKYMGVSLKDPIIVGASALTDNMASIMQIEKAGAGARNPA